MKLVTMVRPRSHEDISALFSIVGVRSVSAGLSFVAP